VGDAEQLGREDSDGGGTPARMTVEIKDYQDVWLPAGGELTGIELEGGREEELGQSLFYNDAARTTLSTVGLQEGDKYTVNVTFPQRPDDAQLAQQKFAELNLPKVLNDPPVIASTAAELVGEAKTPIEQVRALEQTLQEQGFFSNGKEDQPPSLAGHGASRMLRLLDAEQMIGDDEQYAVAMALMARKLDMPARVVMGFYPDWEDIGTPTGPIDIKGGDVHAWVEIAFEDIGWVPFDPTPDEDNEPVPPQQQPKSTPKPQVLQPPPPPQEPAELPPDSAPEPQDAEQKQEDFWAILGPILAVIGIAMIPVGILLLPLLLIAFLKLRRRRRRASEGQPSRRVGGGWEEVMSLATDMGAQTNPKATRRESAAELGEAFPQSATATLQLAQRADRSIFSAAEPSEAEVRNYWDHVDSSLEQMRGSVGFWRRQRAKYSPRSLFQETRLALEGKRLFSRGGKHK
jgi:Transglutaminase-like superfamily